MPSAFGSQIDSGGQYVTITRNTSIVSSQGQTATVSSVMPILAIPDATYRFSPTGGWHMPTSMFTVIRIPKWIGSTPSLSATGNRIGAMISTIDDGSITLPASSSITLTTSRKPITPSPCATIHDAIACGICSLVIRNENSTALVMMYSSIALMLADA